MIVFKCDQCNRPIDGRRSIMVLHVPTGKDDGFISTRHDLCPSCTEKLGLLRQSAPKRRDWIFRMKRRE